MKIFDQRKYPELFLGKSGLSVAKAGCYSVCLAMISNKTVEDTIALFNKNGVYNSLGNIIHSKENIVGFDTYQLVENDPKCLCIAEVDFNPDPDKDQHFVVWLGDGNIVDPWGGIRKKNEYKIYSYRIYKPLIIKEKIMTEEQEKNYKKIASKVGKYTKVDYGDNPNDKETEEMLSSLETIVNKNPQIVEKIVEKRVEVPVEIIKEKIVYREIDQMTIGDLVGQIVKLIKSKL